MIVNEEQRWLCNNLREYEQIFHNFTSLKHQIIFVCSSNAHLTKASRACCVNSMSQGHIYILVLTHISEVDLVLFVQEVEIFSTNEPHVSHTTWCHASWGKNGPLFQWMMIYFQLLVCSDWFWNILACYKYLFFSPNYRLLKLNELMCSLSGFCITCLYILMYLSLFAITWSPISDFL